MKSLSSTFRLPLLTSVFWLVSSNLLQAQVTVDFSHSYTSGGSVTQNTSDITLAFTVDGSGNVTLDATSADTDPASYVNEFDGPVGTVSDPAMYGQSFSLVLSETGSGNLRIDNTGSGLASQGGSAQLIDTSTSGEKEIITVTVNASRFVLQGVSYAGKTSSGGFALNSTLYIPSSSSGTEDVSDQGVNGTFSLSSSSTSTGQGFVLSGFSFDLLAESGGFDNSSGDNLWSTATNWDANVVPSAPSDVTIDGHDVILNSSVPTVGGLNITAGSLTINNSSSLFIASMTLGSVLESDVSLFINGSAASLNHTGSGVFTVGGSTTVITKPDNSGSSPLELDSGTLVLEIGYEWILDGSNYTGSFNVGDKFYLVNFGSLNGPRFGSSHEDGFSDTAGFRTRNFNLPANCKLQLVETASSIYYEVVAQMAATGPNIILINVDDLAGGQHFNFEGRDSITPTMDTLVTNGIRFTAASAASTVCGPSRYSLMTSRWASRNTSDQFIARYALNTLGRFGVSDTELESDNQNLGAWLQQAGYRTGMVGKGHFTDDDLIQTANWATKGLLTYDESADPQTDATTNAKMKHNHRVLCQRMRAFGFNYVGSYYKANLKELYNDYLNVHNQEWITKGALDFIDENKDERFFLYMAPTINHGPVRNDLTKTLRADNRFTSAGYLPSEDYSFMPTRQSIIDQVNNGGKELISARETWLDYSVQAIINKLTEHGIRNDTLIIFTADHGEKDLNSTRAGQGPVIWGKSSLFDLGMRVPLIMNWPNGITSPGRNYDEIVSHVDLAPTLLALTGASSIPTRSMDGVSLVSVLNGSNTAVRQDLFAELGYARAVRTKDRKYVAVRYTPDVYDLISTGYLWERVEGNTATGELTEPRPYYVSNRQLGSLAANSHPDNTYYADDQLYNLTTDPNEDSNIYGQEPATAYDLKKRLANYIGGITNRPFRQFSDGSTEFSLASASAPTAPTGLQMQLTNLNAVQLDWTDAANSELGYIVEKSVNGNSYEVIAETPPGVTTSSVTVDAGVEDIILQVSAYNAAGNASSTVDLLAPNSWRYRTFGGSDPELDDASSQWTADADGDGQSNLAEYTLGSDPLLDTSRAPQPTAELKTDGPSQYLELRVNRDARRTVQINGSVTSDLSDENSWGSANVSVVENGSDHILFRCTTPVGNASRQFMRAEIEAPAP